MRALVVTAALALALISVASTAAVQQERASEQGSQLTWRHLIVQQLRKERAETARLRAVLRHRPSVREALALAAATFGVSRDELARIAFCESRFQPDATNGRYVGLMQFGPLWYSTPYAALPRTSAYAAALAAAWVRREQGSWRAWACPAS